MLLLPSPTNVIPPTPTAAARGFPTAAELVKEFMQGVQQGMAFLDLPAPPQHPPPLMKTSIPFPSLDTPPVKSAPEDQASQSLNSVNTPPADESSSENVECIPPTPPQAMMTVDETKAATPPQYDLTPTQSAFDSLTSPPPSHDTHKSTGSLNPELSSLLSPPAIVVQPEPVEAITPVNPPQEMPDISALARPRGAKVCVFSVF